jgi:DNA topoisomerase VI subunit B
VLEKSIERKVRLPMFSPHASIDFDAPTGPNDFKFTSSVQYAKTPAELRTDPQTLIYGMDWLERHPRAKSVTARWLYSEFYRPGAKRRGRIKVVSVTLTRAEIAEELARHVLPVARQLRRLVRAQADWTDVPISSDAYEAAPCNAYGTACHLVDRCPPPKTKWLQIVRFVGVPK